MFAANRRERFVTSYKPPSDILKFQELSASFRRSEDIKEFSLGSGAVVPAINLLKNDKVAVVNSFIPDGETFPMHEHDVYEWLIPYMGVMKVDTGGGVLMVGPDKETKYIIFQPGDPHSVSAIGDVGLIGITIPADEGYPGAKR